MPAHPCSETESAVTLTGKLRKFHYGGFWHQDQPFVTHTELTAEIERTRIESGLASHIAHTQSAWSNPG